jgi:MFS family permease
MVLSAFFVGCMLCMFIAGLLATRFGGKRVAGGAVLVWSIFTLLTPLACGHFDPDTDRRANRPGYG